MAQKSIKDVFGKVECYTSNISELAGEINDEITVNEETNKIEIDLNGVASLLQVFWNKVKETAQECEGKTIEVKLPAGLAGNIISAALGLVGFKL